MTDDSILKAKQVGAMVGLGRTTIWTRVREGTFPVAVQLGGNRVGWRLSDIQRWVEARPQNHPRSAEPKPAAKAVKQASSPSVSMPPITTSQSAKSKRSAPTKSFRPGPAEQFVFPFE